MNPKTLILASALLLCLTGCASAPAFPAANVSLTSPSGTVLQDTVEVASTPEQQRQGLMGRTAVEHGMLFTFTQPQVLTFWMKDTLVPLDVLFFAADGSFVSYASMEPCTSDPCPTYESSLPALYGLEEPAGYVRSHGIGQGWKLAIGSGAVRP